MTSTKDHYQVLIVGAGSGGLSVAARLGKARKDLERRRGLFERGAASDAASVHLVAQRHGFLGFLDQHEGRFQIAPHQR